MRPRGNAEKKWFICRSDSRFCGCYKPRNKYIKPERIYINKYNRRKVNQTIKVTLKDATIS